ncbi:cytochrome P450 [Amylocystis lapponica]|nr:cytochrome P450 [Amylocystis lapponica]
MTGNIPLALLLCAIAWFLRRYLQHRSANTTINNLPGPPSTSFWTGNIRQIYDPQGWAFHRDISLSYGPVVKMHAFFNRPLLYVYDPRALQHIIVKDQHVYEENEMFIMSNLLAFGPGLLSTLGNHHKKQRKMLNPVFSMNHMRHMLPIFYRVVGQLRQAIAARVSEGPKEVDVLDWMGRTALELIGQGGLGYSFDRLVEDTPNEYRDALKAYVPTILSLTVYRTSIPYIGGLGPPAFRRWVMEMIPHKQIQKMKNIVDIMSERASDIFTEKKNAFRAGDEAVLRQVGEGKDIMSVLMKANMEASEDDKLPEPELIAQMATLLFAATDTTSNALSRILDVLVQHPDAQEQLRKEILDASQGRELSYDELMQLPYLDAVCRETLRLYPPVTIIRRDARKDAILPLSEPIRGRDGTLIHEIPVPKGTQIVVGIQGSNCNKALWGEDALEWKPERWLSPLPDTVTNARVPGVYSNLMTFIGGGRACIGFKFSELEMKAVLCTLLLSFRFEPPKEQITWNIAGVHYPTMGNGNKPQMLLKVTALKSGTA